MSSTSFICIVCSKSLKSNDEIVVTQCGHVFHGICLKTRNKESQQCPQCLSEIKNTTRVYLNASKIHYGQIAEEFDIISNFSKSEVSLKSELDVCKRENQKLKDELTKKSKEIIEKKKLLEGLSPQIQAWHNALVKQSTALYNLKSELLASKRENQRHEDELTIKSKELIEKKKQLEKSAQQIQAWQNALAKKTMELYNLKSEIDVCKRENQKLQDELIKKSKEIIEKNKQLEESAPQIQAWQNELAKKTIELYNLKGQMVNGKSSTLSNALQEDINVLQEKNRQISQELAKEIRNSGQLFLEKQQLESLTKQLKLKTAQKANDDDLQKKNENFDKFTEKSATVELDVQSAVIKNIKQNFADYEDMRKYVYKLTDLMGLYYTGNDILDIYTLHRYEEKISLVVKFKTLQMKSMFLSKKNKLKENTSTKDIVLYEFVNNETHLLLQQAKALRSFGFKHVYCRNNVVYAKRQNGSAPKTIKNIDDIEKLKTENHPTSNYDYGE